jgi:hypothetical protein
VLRKISVFAIVFLVLAACASYPASATVLSPDQTSLVDATCTRIMGLRKGEYYYAMCQESLTRSLAARTEGEARARSYDDCRRQGYAEDSAALSVCVLEKQDAAPARLASANVSAQLVLPHDDPDAGESYYNVTPSAHWKREQYSCAQLGFVPGSSVFANCVARLDADLLPGLE